MDGFTLDILPAGAEVEVDWRGDEAGVWKKVRMRRVGGRWTRWKPVGCQFYWSELRPPRSLTLYLYLNILAMIFNAAALYLIHGAGWMGLVSVGAMAATGLRALSLLGLRMEWDRDPRQVREGT